ATVPAPVAGSSFSPTQPTGPIPLGVAVWQRSPGQWQWPSQAQAQEQSPVGVLPPGATGAAFPDGEKDKFASNGRTTGPDVQAYRWGRRLFFYGTLLIALLLQILVFVLLIRKQGTEVIADLFVFLASSINLLVRVAIG